MKIEEMIKELQKAHDKYGNIEVVFDDGDYLQDTSVVEVLKKRKCRSLSRQEALEYGYDKEYVERAYDRNQLCLDGWCDTDEYHWVIG